MSAVLIGLHLERLGLSAGGIGLILTIALLSAAGTGLAAANLSSRIGRRYTRALVGAVTATLALLLSARAEGPVSSASLSAAQVRVLAPLSALFAVDAVGGGLVANAVIAYWLHVRFGASAAALGSTFTAIALLQSASYEVSGRLANRIGLIRTMVFTHVPSNVLLALVPLSPTLPWAIAILFARFSLS